MIQNNLERNPSHMDCFATLAMTEIVHICHCERSEAIQSIVLLSSYCGSVPSSVWGYLGDGLESLWCQSILVTVVMSSKTVLFEGTQW